MITIRVLYVVAIPQVFLNTDSEGYIILGRRMYAQPTIKNIINPYRTPLYPLFTQGLFVVSGQPAGKFYTPEFFQVASLITTIQSTLSIAAFVLLFFALIFIGIPLRLSWIFILMTSCDYFVLLWERSILTEGLAIPWMIIVTAVALFMMRSRTLWRYVLLFLLFIIGFFLRPALLLVPIIISGILFFYRHTVRRGIAILILLGAYLLVPFGYAKVNEYYHEYLGIQHVGDIDLLGKILEFQLPVESARSYEFYYNAVVASRNMSKKFPNPFELILQHIQKPQ